MINPPEEIIGEITLISEAWYKDRPLLLGFPESWSVYLFRGSRIPAISTERIKQNILNPIGSKPLREIAKNHSRATIIVDDLTRPTPVNRLIKIVIGELKGAGITPGSITIVVGGGSHLPTPESDLMLKFGPDILSEFKVIAHNCSENLVDLGKTSRGTPLTINRTVSESDLLIGLGCIYPHPAAGFSGGSKIVAPAAAGAETIRYMHDHLQAADQRAGSMDTEFRKEVEEIASMVGLDFIVNVVLNQGREIAAVFAGDKVLAQQAGIEFASECYTISPMDDANIVIADMYPFDVDLQFAYDRGFWPLLRVKSEASKVILAACPKGAGSHQLYPVTNTLIQRYTQRLKKLHWRDLRSPLHKIKKAHRLHKQKSLDFMMLSSGIRESEMKTVFKNGCLYRSWDEVLGELKHRHESPSTKVAVYQCAPFLIPT